MRARLTDARRSPRHPVAPSPDALDRVLVVAAALSSLIALLLLCHYATMGL